MVNYAVLVVAHAGMTAVVFISARAIFQAVGRGSAARRTHGRYVLAWMVAGYAALPVGLITATAILRQNADRKWGVPGALFASYLYGMFGLLAGWVVGTVHGGLVLAWRWWRTPGRPPG